MLACQSVIALNGEKIHTKDRVTDASLFQVFTDNQSGLGQSNQFPHLGC